MNFGITMPSGLDDNSIINQLVAVEAAKVTKVEKEKDAFQVKIDAYSKIRSLLWDIKQKASALSKITSFDLFSSSSTDKDAVTIKGSTGGVDGQYDVKVFQLAGYEKMISADNRITDQSASLSSQGISVGDISISGVTLTVSATDTIQDLRSKINNAVDAQGKRLGVTASVVKMSDANYRIILTARDTGSTGVTYKDLTGQTLQGLGLIATAEGEKGNIKQIVQSADDIVSAWNALAVGDSVRYGGADHDGRAVTNTFIKTAGSTIDTFLRQVASTYHGMADVTTDGTGRLVLTDKAAGSSHLTLNALTFGTTAHAATVVQAGAEGPGVLSAGKDAYFSIEGMAMNAANNSINGFVAGVTFELHDVSAEKAVTVALKRDNEAIKDTFKELLDAYNAISEYAGEATKMANPKDKKSKSGDLAGDMSVATIVSSVRDAFRKRYDLFGGDITSFASIGVKSDGKTGTLSLDEEKFIKTLEENLPKVQRLFVSIGASDKGTITLGRFTKDTQATKYELEETDPNFVRIRRVGDTQWYTSDPRMGDIVSFSQGPASGLSISAVPGAVGAAANFTFSKGLATTLDESINTLTDIEKGVVSLRQNALQKSIARADDRIARLTDRTEQYRTRLIRQFGDMETMLSILKQQGSRLSSMFGSY